MFRGKVGTDVGDPSAAALIGTELVVRLPPPTVATRAAA
eukprot:COSAG05_NODE_26876_length_177_cov_1554.858974_1_plen_38_part_01